MVPATVMFVGFVAALFAGAIVLPGPVREGQPLADGTRKRYKLTGMTLFLATHVAVGAGTLLLGLSLAPLLAHFGALFAAATLVSLAAAAVLWLEARAKGEGRGAFLPDFCLGAQLNPTWLGVDLKMFAYQPSLIGFWLLVLAFAYAQVERHGHLTLRMALFQVFWWVYLVTHYRREEFMLQTWDIIAEKFGLALLWGDLALVPFFYCIGGWYLVDNLAPLPAPAALGITLLYLLALWMFRGANDQKHRFKRDRSAVIWGGPAEALDGKLLVSGWWGIGRHLNYTGEVGVYLAVALTTGFGSIVPYLLPLWLAGLLAHRALRDERRCRAKYGALWAAYCARARFRMLPLAY
jgi:delta14-sterol reductase